MTGEKNKDLKRKVREFRKELKSKRKIIISKVRNTKANKPNRMCLKRNRI